MTDTGPLGSSISGQVMSSCPAQLSDSDKREEQIQLETYYYYTWGHLSLSSLFLDTNCHKMVIFVAI